MGMKQELGEHMDDDTDQDEMPEILPRHFESAVRQARRSVTDRDLSLYASFAQTLQQSRASVGGLTGGSLASFSFPGQGQMEGIGDSTVDDEEEEEDLYS